MKTPKAVAEDICRELGMLRRFGDSENVPPVERLIAARDAEHAASSSVAWEALQRIAEYDTDWTKGAAENVNILQGIAEAALALRPGKP